MKHAGDYVQPTSVRLTVCIPYQGRTVPARCPKGGGTYGRTDCSGDAIHAGACEQPSSVHRLGGEHL